MELEQLEQAVQEIPVTGQVIIGMPIVDQPEGKIPQLELIDMQIYRPVLYQGDGHIEKYVLEDSATMQRVVGWE